MKTFLKISMVSFLAVFLVTGYAMALPYGGSAASLQGALDGITVGPNPGISSVNVETDYLDDTNDSNWDITATGGSISTVIIEIASYAAENTFGVYNGTQYVELFAGSDTTGSQVTLSLMADGSVFVNHSDTGKDFASTTFGYYLDSRAANPSNSGLWHSNTALNADGEDHMLAYQGTNTDTVQIGLWAPGLWTNNEYILAFEDLNGAIRSDHDYSDFVVMVESVRPVPEPATMLLSGLGLLGIGAYLRRRFNKA